MKTTLYLHSSKDDMIYIAETELELSKEANLGALLLVRDFKLQIKGSEQIDISCDIHIRRVFQRTGLVVSDSAEDIINVARILNPTCPGALTTPFWIIGKNWCHSQFPTCSPCPLSSSCAQIVG